MVALPSPTPPSMIPKYELARIDISEVVSKLQDDVASSTGGTTKKSDDISESDISDVASSTGGTTKKSDDISESDISDAQVQASNLVAVANETLSRKRFIPALCFAAAAAAIFSNIEALRAGLPLNALTQQIDEKGLVASASSVDWRAILETAATKALGDGKAGAYAALFQVISVHWLHTAITYQFRYGGDLQGALKTLYDKGGLARLYRGLPLAMVQIPFARFGEIAANVGVLALFDGIPQAAGLPLPLKTAAGSLAAGLWRIFCMPIDTAKTVLQVEGKAGFQKLQQKVLTQGPGPLYQGSLAIAGASIVGTFPWFLTYRFLDGMLPQASTGRALASIIRDALLGVSAACASSTVTNSLKVISTTQQTALMKSADGEEIVDAEGAETRAKAGEKSADPKSISFVDAVRLVIEADGIKGLFGRGLKSRYLLSVISGSLFGVMWKVFQNPIR